MKKVLIWVIILLVVLLLALNFHKADDLKNTVTGSNKSEFVAIGVLAPFTGVAAESAEYMKNAVQLAEKEINESGDNKTKIKLIFEDTEYSPEAGVSAFNKLADIDDVDYFVGPYSSTVVLAVAPIADTKKKIVIAPGAQSGEIGSSSQYVFRTIHNTSQEAPVFAKFIAENMKGDEIHFVALNNPVSPSYLNDFTPTFESYGKSTGLIEYFDPTASDLRTQLTKIKSQNPTDIFVIAAPRHTGMILNQADELGIDAQFYSIGVEGPDLFRIAGELANGLIYPYSYDNENAETKVKMFKEKYLQEYGIEPDAVAANSFDSVMLLSKCFEDVGVDVDDVKNCLLGIKDYSGASGNLNFDENGDAVRNIFIKKVLNGKYVKYED